MRSLSAFTIPNGVSFETPRAPAQGGGTNYYTFGDAYPTAGCDVTAPAGLIPVPHGATSVTVPAGHDFAIAEQICNANEGQGAPIPRGDSGLDVFNVGSFTITVADATLHDATQTVEHVHPSGVAAGVTGLGFYCGRQYYWRDIAADAEFSIFLTAAQRSMIGSVYLDSDGSQIVNCVGHRLIFRPDDQ